MRKAPSLGASHLSDSAVSRTPWLSAFPPVFVHTKWKGSSGVISLSRRPGYMAAKKLGDVNAAKRIIEYLLAEETVYAIGDQLKSDNTYVVCPARTFSNPGNALPHVYALILANEFGLKVCTSIYQHDGPKRDLSDFWDRFSRPVTYTGHVFSGADYVLVDDVFSTGGTLATLRAFIEQQGGNVICTSAIASPSGMTAPIAIDHATVMLLNSKHGLGLRTFIRTEVGYELECLTEPEARTLHDQRTLDDIRAKVTEARHK